jgi:predicted outer membrane repeat protein
MVGFSLAAASPAAAATDADCNAGNTLTAPADDATDIQTLLTASTPIICLNGTFAVGTTLTYDYDVTIHGLADAVLDGGGSVGILEDLGSNAITVENLTLSNANGSSSGGAIDGYFVAAIDSYFTGDAASNGGAISGYSVFAGGSTFDSNETSGSGGAISAPIVEVENSTFVGNSGYGGAIVAFSALISQSTFLDNVSSDPQGGQSIYLSGPGDAELRGNIFAGPTSDEQLGSDDPTVQFTDMAGNLFTTAAESRLASPDPSSQFGLTTLAIFGGNTLADNGGPTPTVALPFGSPAIDAVPVGTGVTIDQRGEGRSTNSDAGAYEQTGTAPAALAATGSAPAGWLGGVAALLLAAGAVTLGAARRVMRAR